MSFKSVITSKWFPGITGTGSRLKALGIGGKGGSGSGYQFKPYSGLKPPRIDYTDPATGQPTNYLRSTQALVQDIIPNRAKGNDVGYAPEWLKLNNDLIRSNVEKDREDQVRSAAGSLSAAGLSGNPRAIEATKGRINRDAGRTLADAMTQISIADLERKNQERDVNTGRLQNLNLTNFGQENKAADFDLAVYGAEEGNRAGAFNMNTGLDQYFQNRDDEMLGGLMELGGTAIGGYFGGPGGAMVGQQAASALKNSGTGIAPTSNIQSTGGYYQPLKYKSARSLVR